MFIKRDSIKKGIHPVDEFLFSVSGIKENLLQTILVQLINFFPFANLRTFVCAGASCKISIYKIIIVSQ